MNIFPAIDLYGGKAVRLYKGDYAQMTVYSDTPYEVALDFERQGAKFLHLVDLEGAKSGLTPNLETIKAIIEKTDLFTEVGGGIRNIETVRTYLNAGVDRVILGTAAVTDPEFLKAAVSEYGEKIAVGADIKDGKIAIKGWTETADYTVDSFFEYIESVGVKTVICTDISKDGAMAGTNLDLYRRLLDRFNIDLVASGGVSSMNDVKALREMNIYGAILGKALYVGGIDLAEAIAASK